ncbi:hypothetical protein BC941DRAFT_499364 [Chlamydoabsidia padenii]|nr:hypothetical protein BC941DRAFT_499364 [Chlamydoabsidia padenii]
MIQTDSSRDGRRLTGYNNHQVHHGHTQQQRHSLYDDDMEDNNQQHHQHYYYDDGEGEEDDDEGHEDEDEDDTGSVLSVPDPNINFDLVYALHTFAATVDGQASVVKGDALTLLDDSNSYWWLVKVLKTSEVGYIPAENIETPYERLARLNSHRNIELTRRDIQDAFPAPPSTKAKATKRVTLAKGVKFQAQVIFGGSDDEGDFAEEYEEWDEALLSSDSDDNSSDSDDYDYYSSHLSGNGYSNNQMQSDYNIYQQSTMSNSNNKINKGVRVPPIVTQSLDHRHSGNSMDSPLSTLSNNKNGTRDTLDLEQSETIKISLTPSIARGEVDDSYGGYNNRSQQQQQQKKTMNKLERLLGEDDPSTSPTSPRNSGGSGKKSSIRKFFSRGSKDGGNYGKRKDSKTSSLGADSILSETASVSSQSTTSYSERNRSGSLDSAMLLQTQGTSSDHNNVNTTGTPTYSDHTRYFTPTDGPNSVMASPTSPSSIMSPSSFTSSLLPVDQQLHHLQPHHHHHQPDEQPVELMIYGGNLTLGQGAKPALAYSTTTAMELIQQVVDTLDSEASEPVEDRATNFYLVVKGVDGDEYTLVPSDRPLSIYHSLTGHLNTPMPSLKKARRISQLMSTTADTSTHIGGPSYHQASSPTSPGGLESAGLTVRFYLHSKRRTTHEEGVIRIKVSLLKSEMVDQEELFGLGQVRVDKSLFVPHTGSVGDVAALILERFHLLNGVVDGSPDLNDRIKALRLDGGSENQAVLYRLNVFRNGQEFVLNVNDPIINAYEGDMMPTIHHPRGSNPDRSSIASMSSVIHSPQADETFFVLRRVHHRLEHHSADVQQTTQPPQRPARSHRPPIRQNTPMPHTKSADEPGAIPPMHPLQTNNDDYSQDRSASPLEMAPVQTVDRQTHSPSHHPATVDPGYYSDTNNEQVTPEDGDVLMQLDAALDSLAHTRNSNEPLTEAITYHQQRSKGGDAVPSPINRDPSPLSVSSSTMDSTPVRSQVLDDPPTSTTSTTSTLSTVATSMTSEPLGMMTPQQDMTPPMKTKGRRGSIQSMLYWDDFGMEELMIMIRGSAKCQEAKEKKEAEKKNRRSSRHYTAPIRSEINEVFKDSHVQLEQLEKELDMLMAQAVKTYC